MALRGIQCEMRGLTHIGREPDLTLEARGQGNRDLIHIDHQCVACPMQSAWANGEVIWPIIQSTFAALGHGPFIVGPACFGAVQRYINRDVVVGIFSTRPRVVGREDRTDKGDD